MLERKINSLKGGERLDNQFNEDSLPLSDRADFCYNLTRESKNKLDIEQAKSGLL